MEHEMRTMKRSRWVIGSAFAGLILASTITSAGAATNNGDEQPDNCSIDHIVCYKSCEGLGDSCYHDCDVKFVSCHPARGSSTRSEERRVGKECRSRWS